jgi:hypothetical protein
MNTGIETNAQSKAIAQLERQGFKFSNWIAASPNAENEAIGEAQTAVMVKRGATRFGREYREVEPDGSIN